MLRFKKIATELHIMTNIDSLLEVMQKLRDPESGCPWDMQQTSESIAPHTLAETHELLEAIENKDIDNIREELGDCLFNIIFHSRIAQEKNQFDFNDVVSSIVEKMVRRHPHVFANPDNLKFSQEQLRGQWQSIKEREKALQPAKKTGAESASLPPIYRAHEIQKQAAKSGFDWPDISMVLDKLDEEVQELKHAIQSQDKVDIQDELGDVMFVLINIGRHLKIDAEMALRSTNRKFNQRFCHVVEAMQKAGIEMNSDQLEMMETFWQQAKAIPDGA